MTSDRCLRTNMFANECECPDCGYEHFSPCLFPSLKAEKVCLSGEKCAPRYETGSDPPGWRCGVCGWALNLVKTER